MQEKSAALIMMPPIPVNLGAGAMMNDERQLEIPGREKIVDVNQDSEWGNILSARCCEGRRPPGMPYIIAPLSVKKVGQWWDKMQQSYSHKK